MTIPQAIGLGVLQGLTEFLPVSSSGHLVLARALLGAREAPVTFEVLLHAASLVAILLFFRREILTLATTRRRLIPALVVGTIPAAAVGFLLRDRLEALFESPTGVGVALLFTGTVLLVSERRGTGHRELGDVRWQDGLWIGVAQAIALVPGVSRSGMTVGGGLLSGLERRAAVAFAFLLGAIAIAGATALKAKDIARAGREGRQTAAAVTASPTETVSGTGAGPGEGQPPGAQAGLAAPMVAGSVAALVASLVALVLLTEVVRRKLLAGFAIYCYLLGGAVLLAKLTGLW